MGMTWDVPEACTVPSYVMSGSIERWSKCLRSVYGCMMVLGRQWGTIKIVRDSV